MCVQFAVQLRDVCFAKLYPGRFKWLERLYITRATLHCVLPLPLRSSRVLGLWAGAVPGLPEWSLRAELLNCFAWALIYQHE